MRYIADYLRGHRGGARRPFIAPAPGRSIRTYARSVATRHVPAGTEGILSKVEDGRWWAYLGGKRVAVEVGLFGVDFDVIE